MRAFGARYGELDFLDFSKNLIVVWRSVEHKTEVGLDYMMSRESNIGMTEREIIHQMTRLAKLLDIGTEKGFNPGSFRVLIDLFNRDLSFLVVVEMWYFKHRALVEWKEFFQENGMGWLWTLYKDKNGEDLDRLSNYLRENAQTA